MAEPSATSTAPAPVRGSAGAGSPQTPSKSSPSVAARGSAGSPSPSTGDGAAEGGPSAGGKLGQFRLSAEAFGIVLEAVNSETNLYFFPYASNKFGFHTTRRKYWLQKITADQAFVSVCLPNNTSLPSYDTLYGHIEKIVTESTLLAANNSLGREMEEHSNTVDGATTFYRTQGPNVDDHDPDRSFNFAPFKLLEVSSELREFATDIGIRIGNTANGLADGGFFKRMQDDLERSRTPGPTGGLCDDHVQIYTEGATEAYALCTSSGGNLDTWTDTDRRSARTAGGVLLSTTAVADPITAAIVD